MCIRIYSSLIIGIFVACLFSACDGPQELTGIDQVQSASSQLCQNVVGAEAILWDIANGIIRTDLPGGVPPTVSSIGGNFFHPNYPPLSFIYPTGWTPETIAAQQTVGVNLIRQDTQAILRWVGASVNGLPNVRQIRDLEVNQLIQFLQAEGNVQSVCVHETTTTPAPGISLNFSSIFIRVGGYTALVTAQVTELGGLPSSQVGVQVAAGPSNEYDRLIFDVYLAIGFQLLYGRETIQDSDGDGVQDSIDRFPFDPTRQ